MSSTTTRTTSTLGWITRGAAANLALPLAALATSPILARVLGADGRGALAAVTVPVLLGYSALTLGLPEALTFFVGRTGLRPRQLRLLVIGLPLLVGGLAWAAVWWAMPLLLHQYPEHVTLARLVFAAVPLTMVVQALRGVALGSQDYRDVYLERFLGVVLRLTPVVVLALVGALTVSTAAAVAVSGGILSGVLLLGPYRRARARTVADPPTTPAVLRYGGLVWFGAVAQLLMFRLDQLVLATLVPAAALGAYAVAVSLAEVSNSLTAAVKEVLHGRASDRSDPVLLARGCRLAVAASVSFAVVASVAVQVALVPVFGADFAPAVALTQVLLLASVGSGLGSVVGIGLAVVGRPGAWSAAQLLGMVTTLVLVVPVVRDQGVLGAAWLSVTTYLLTALWGAWRLARTTGQPVSHHLLPQRGDLAWLRHRVRRRTDRSET